MSREWKPGAVGHSAFGRVFNTDHGWVFEDDSGYPAADEINGFRPLVVIDPEDREQVERLAKFMHESDHIAPWHDLHNETRSQMEDAMQAALREFANPTPPKPDEPTGLGAVIEAICGCNDEARRFVRDPDARDFNLSPSVRGAATGAEVPWVSRCGHHHYDHLTLVRVLSEGVPS